MRILLSNDDGIHAPGLAALHDAVADLGEVITVAPASPQSAASHSITVLAPLTVQAEHVNSPAGGFEGFSVDGSPADCVRLALREMLEPVDLVLSGMNHGANLGVHVLYSGTVAAAAEGAVLGVPAIAFSAGRAGQEVDFATAAGHCRAVLDGLLAGGLHPGELISVNVPDPARGAPKGVAVVRQADSELHEDYQLLSEHDGRRIYELRDYRFADGAGDNDVDLFAAGWVTVTPLNTDLTRHGRLDELRDMDLNCR